MDGEKDMKDQYCEKIEKMYVELYERLFWHANNTFHDKPLAEEAVQETFCIVCARKETVFASPNPQGWVFNTLKYVMRNMVRSQAKVNDLLLHHGAELSKSADAKTKLPDIRLAYGDISDTEEFQLMLGVANGMSMLELADQQGISVETCKKRVQRARTFIRRKIPL